ncbi:type II toxin-antitoxin system RelE/ParE family toxin [Marixanthomonas spongiae]|uniref:Plasmid stabilization protein n=1 Tax=Marixanthomonas spongiae TaxID=2174845 RepID=A0A2U0I7P4_9FLAO|nr:type II toxin-antitoxin system RelE/ParE family toxin [Marixanthomonas spongiae]PVW17070.1 plasmid stabilization protein [Marixanthomonas spongiae]
MAQLTLVWTKTALKQRNLIFKYWNKRNKSTEYSKRLRNVIDERTKLILSFPEMGKKAEYGNHLTVPLEHYTIFYRKVEEKIVITALWDNNQNPKKLLKILKDN